MEERKERILAGKYHIQREIATGGMGMVYYAIDLTLRREVAIKVLHQKYGEDTSFDRRFLQEARGLARLDHPNIVRIYAVEKEEGAHYIVMEYFPGQDLKHILRERGPLHLSKVLHVAIELTKALAYAHNKKIIHRDVKPANILVGEQDSIKITDFGIAAVLDEPGATVAGTIMGTPEYMSPEQARGDHVNAGSDLYSLGIVIYEMLTGKGPYQGLPGASIVGKLAYDRSEIDLVFPSNIPETLQYLIRGLTKKDPGDRLKDARLVLETLIDHQEKLKALEPDAGLDETILVPSRSGESPRSDLQPPNSILKDKPEAPSDSQPLVRDTPHQKIPEDLRKSSSSIRALAIGLAGSLFLVGLVVLILYQWPFMKDQTIGEVKPPRQEGQESPLSVTAVIQNLERLQQDYINEITQQQQTTQAILSQSDTLLVSIRGITSGLDSERSQKKLQAAEQGLAGLQQQIRQEYLRQQASVKKRSKVVEAVLAKVGQVQYEKLEEGRRRALEEIPDAIQAAKQKLTQEQAFFKQETNRKLAALNSALIQKKKAVGEARRQSPRREPLADLDKERLNEILNHFQIAYENHDLATLQRTTKMEGSRIKQVTLMFNAYPTIKIVTDVQTVTDQGATAKIVITKLLNQKGQSIKPSPIIAVTEVWIPKEGGRWGKIQW